MFYEVSEGADRLEFRPLPWGVLVDAPGERVPDHSQKAGRPTGYAGAVACVGQTCIAYPRRPYRCAGRPFAADDPLWEAGTIPRRDCSTG